MTGKVEPTPTRALSIGTPERWTPSGEVVGLPDHRSGISSWRRSFAVWGGILALVAIGSTTGCGGGGEKVGQERPTPGTTRLTSVPTPTPSPTPAPITPTEYQAALSSLDAALVPRFSAVFLSGTPGDLSTAFESARDELRARSRTLSQIRPPVNVTAAHRDLVSALGILTSDLSKLAGDADNRVLCTGGAGVPRAASGNGAHVLRQAANAIVNADPTQSYKVGTFLPAGQPDLNRRPANGNLGPGKRGGLGRLTVTASSVDAVIKLANGQSPVRNIYIRAGSTVTVDGIPDGTFNVFYTTGTDWDSTSSRFTRDCDFAKFDEPLTYRTTRSQYTTYTLTLYKTIGGNARSRDVPPGSFPTF